ncbi:MULTISPECIES: polysaccharide deacetylase family protein [Pseudomonas]|uniref:Polysaccharide deacetylase n=1 Tax=Pseudomonas piscis TaxID=2614538 RepID=A0ABY9NMN6_9PSED|nr:MULTISPECIES: polysaccharide deacetylase [Pseudomonas]POA51329.1 polysaccharide deacetylase [Pseudomonas sp. FW507-12TSA]WMN19575.1 polysaccharide deacetylase [Pseudomonas piscis]
MSGSLPDLPRFPWPHGKQAAVAWSFDVDAEAAILSNDPVARYRLAMMTHQMFGPEVGVPRILDVLRRYGLRSTFFIPGYTAERYPDMVRAIVDGGHEIGHHGYLHEPLRDMSAQQEADVLDRGLEALERVAGMRPRAFRAPLGEMSFLTPPLLADRGFHYDSSLMDSDAPYLLDVGDGSGRTLVELPFHWSSDDWEQYNWIPGFDDGRPIETPRKVHELWWTEIEAQVRYGGLFNLVNHPFVSGRASRIHAMEQMIERLLDDERIWFASLGDIAEHVRSLELAPRVHAPYHWPY